MMFINYFVLSIQTMKSLHVVGLEKDVSSSFLYLRASVLIGLLKHNYFMKNICIIIFSCILCIHPVPYD